MLDDLLLAVGVKDITEISQPLVQMVSDNILYVCNMKGVRKLSDDEVVVCLSKKQNLKIMGSQLKCKMLNKNEITIQGKICSVVFELIKR